jgi:hypothetical protein
MFFSPFETGPSWMTEAQREETHHDQILEEEKFKSSQRKSNLKY